MDLEHSFTVPVDIDTAWAEFQDIGSIAECFPGAQVTGVEGDSFNGSVKVKLGPISLVYNGSGTFVEKDEAVHRFVVDAKGKDKRGNGTAGAKVTLTMAGSGPSTDVTVLTDLSITGKPAQFGRGVMQDVSEKLLGRFVDCLQGRLASDAPAPESSPSADAPPADTAPDTGTPDPGEAGASAPATPVAPATPPPAATPRPATPTTAPRSDDALDLGRTVLPVLAKAYWKQAVVVLVVIVVLIWLIAR